MHRYVFPFPKLLLSRPSLVHPNSVRVCVFSKKIWRAALVGKSMLKIRLMYSAVPEQFCGTSWVETLTRKYTFPFLT